MPVSRLNDENRRAFLGCRRQVSLSNDSNEIQILYHLDMGRVHYCPQSGYLYFCNSFVVEIQGTIESVMSGMGRPCEIERVYLDVHRFFSTASRVRLTPDELTPICVALRMQGIQVSTGAP